MMIVVAQVRQYTCYSNCNINFLSVVVTSLIFLIHSSQRASVMVRF